MALPISFVATKMLWVQDPMTRNGHRSITRVDYSFTKKWEKRPTRSLEIKWRIINHDQFLWQLQCFEWIVQNGTLRKITFAKIAQILFIYLFMYKNIVKGDTQVSGHSLKLHFCMFERSQGKHNSLNCHKKNWNIFH
jgi:hypothetical protein